MFEGATTHGRHSAAILRMIRVNETIPTTIDDYVAIAARFWPGFRIPGDRSFRARPKIGTKFVETAPRYFVARDLGYMNSGRLHGKQCYAF
jgi:hypothetical protein